MDIPYTVHPRQDTGLYNAKVGIWLFLASEVMLFGALFSSYILLRVGAPEQTWPHSVLNIPLGTLNTIVLITSSVTVVLGWAQLKLGNFAKYRQIQAVTILCAMMFMVIKSFEYRDKFAHYQVLRKDGTYVDGHIHGSVYLDANKKQHEIHGYKGKAYAEGAKGSETKYTLDHVVINGFEAKTLSEITQPKPHTHPEHKDVKIAAADIVKIGNYGSWHNTYMAIYFTLTGLHALHVLGGALVIGYIWGPGASMWKTDPERYTNRVEISGLFWHFVDLVWIFLFPILYLL
jgi:cytochrome c oxidase subunit 3